MREPELRSAPLPFASRIEFPVMTSAQYDGVGIYAGEQCLFQQDFAVSKYVVPGDLLVVDLSNIWELVAATGDANRIRQLSVRLHSYSFDLPEINVLGRTEPIDLCQGLTNWLAEGF